MAWFIILTMIISTVSFSILYSGNTSDSTTPVPEEIPEQKPANLNFKAENVPATVFQVLPSMKIIASTEEQDITKIDSQIFSITGVKNVTSFFRLAETSGKIDYVAEISYDKTLSTGQMAGLLDSVALIQVQAVFPFAMVEIPKKVTLKPESEDVDIEKEYTFENTMASALIELTSIKDDEIEVELNVTLAGNELVQMAAYETKNITAEFKTHSAKMPLAIFSIEKAVSFSSDAFPYAEINLDALKSSVLSNENITDANIEKKFFIASFEILLSPELVADENALKNAILEVPNTKDVSITDSNALKKIKISFSEDADYPSLKNSIIEKIAISADSLSITGPKLVLNGGVSLVDSYSAETADFIKSKLSALGINVQFFQNAKATLPAITDSELATTYTYDANEFDVKLNTGHKENDTVDLDITYYTARDEVLAIFAEEITE